MSENKKVRNASPNSYNGIYFKSRLETSIYKTLIKEGFLPEYEQRKFILWEGFKPQVPFYRRDNKTKSLKLDKTKLQDITYTPDFTFMYNDRLIIIEAKGIENDVYPVKKKLFRKVLENHYPDSMFFEIHTKRELLEAIKIIKLWETKVNPSQT